VSRLGTHALGGVLGGLAGATTAVLVTELIKSILAVVGRQDTWLLIVVPLVGLALSVVVLNGYHRGEALQTLLREPLEDAEGGRRRAWFRPSGRDVIRADLTADVLATAGQEERFPWRLAPPRIAAIVSTVGLGAPMGTESPAAHMGVAAGAFLGHRARRFAWLARPAGVGGGAAGVAALIGNPIVGTAFILELGRRRNAPLSIERVTAALGGGLVGWGINVAFDLDLIRLNVPDVAPDDFVHGLVAALLVGVVAGTIASLTGSAIYRARGWQAAPVFKFVTGGLAVALAAIAIATIAVPSAAFGPGAGAAAWADTTDAAALTLLTVALLRAAATTAAVAAGGCGGVFVRCAERPRRGRGRRGRDRRRLPPAVHGRGDGARARRAADSHAHLPGHRGRRHGRGPRRGSRPRPRRGAAPPGGAQAGWVVACRTATTPRRRHG